MYRHFSKRPKVQLQHYLDRKNNNFKLLCIMRPYIKQEEVQEPLVIGYYPFRAKAQIPRLICQYLGVRYVDKFFTPDEWKRYKQNQAKNWIMRDLPFVMDGDFVVTGTPAIVHYIVEKSGRTDLFGKTLQDIVKLDKFKGRVDIKLAILSLMCTYCPSNLEQDREKMSHLYSGKIQPALLQYQKDCPENGWYYGYVTIMDFLIYELLGLINAIFPMTMTKFPRLIKLKARLAKNPQIASYQISRRAVKQYSPVAYFNKFRQSKARKGSNKQPSSYDPRDSMEPQV